MRAPRTQREKRMWMHLVFGTTPYRVLRAEYQCTSSTLGNASLLIVDKYDSNKHSVLVPVQVLTC